MAKRIFYWRVAVLLFGVVLTAASALVNHRVVVSSEQQVMEHQTQMATLEQRIRDRWQQVLELERREDVGTLLALMASDPARDGDVAFRNTITGYFNITAERFGVKAPETSITTPPPLSSATWSHWLQSMSKSNSAYRLHATEAINTLYLEKETLREQVDRLRSHSREVSSIAIFLQIMGLMVVLSERLLR